MIPAFLENPLLQCCVRDEFINSHVPLWIPKPASSSRGLAPLPLSVCPARADGTQPLQTSVTASPACPGSYPSTTVSGPASPSLGIGKGAGVGQRMLGLCVDSPLAPGALADGEAMGICRVQADGQITGLSAPRADGQADKSVCLSARRSCLKGLRDASSLQMLFSTFQTYLNRVLIINLLGVKR